MTKATDTIIDTVKEQGENIVEVIRERLFSPMYFYFIIAWIITNWKFVYVLLNTDEGWTLKYLHKFKVDYLTAFYDFSSIWLGFCSISKLFIIPALSTFIIVWYLSKISEKFYRKNEEFKMNKIDIKEGVEHKYKMKKYERLVSQEYEEREIRDAQSDKNDIRYEDNKEFNNWYDQINEEPIELGDASYLPSELLYNVDYEKYKDVLNKFKADPDTLIDVLESSEDKEEILEDIINIQPILTNEQKKYFARVIESMQKQKEVTDEMRKRIEASGLLKKTEEINKQLKPILKKIDKFRKINNY